MASSPRRTPILILLGPTATGKTAIGVDVAQRLRGEIISADSRALFAEMDIVTAKPGIEERRGVAHHLFDHIAVDGEYDAMAFRRDVEQLIPAIAARGHVPIVVGGSTLYLGALLRGIFEGPSKDPNLRRRLEQHPTAELHRRLREVDPGSAAAIHPNDRLRITRALEVYELTGKPIGILQSGAEPLAHPMIVFGLKRDPKDHRASIEERARRMLDSGLVEEVRRLREAGLAPGMQAYRTIGIPEASAFLDGRTTEEDLSQDIVRQTWSLVRRQMTWFRREAEVQWIDVTGRQVHDIAEEIVEQWKEKTT